MWFLTQCGVYNFIQNPCLLFEKKNGFRSIEFLFLKSIKFQFLLIAYKLYFYLFMLQWVIYLFCARGIWFFLRSIIISLAEMQSIFLALFQAGPIIVTYSHFFNPILIWIQLLLFWVQTWKARFVIIKYYFTYWMETDYNLRKDV